MATLIRWFEDIGIDDVGTVGGKNAALGELYRERTPRGILVPNGFAVTAEAYRVFLAQAGLDRLVNRTLAGLDVGNVDDLQARGRSVREAILSAPLPRDLETALVEAYDRLSANAPEPLDVAVRSSATAEDLPEASFAGQQETYLNVRGRAALVESCRRCFASLFTDRAIVYRAERGFAHGQVALSVGVQRMVRADLATAGVMFTRAVPRRAPRPGGAGTPTHADHDERRQPRRGVPPGPAPLRGRWARPPRVHHRLGDRHSPHGAGRRLRGQDRVLRRAPGRRRGHDRGRLPPARRDRAPERLQDQRVRQPARRACLRARRGEPDARLPRRLALLRSALPTGLRHRVPRPAQGARGDGPHQRQAHGAVLPHAGGGPAGDRRARRQRPHPRGEWARAVRDVRDPEQRRAGGGIRPGLRRLLDRLQRPDAARARRRSRLGGRRAPVRRARSGGHGDDRAGDPHRARGGPQDRHLRPGAERLCGIRRVPGRAGDRQHLAQPRRRAAYDARAAPSGGAARATDSRRGEPLPEAARLRLDHGALAALLVPPPTAAIGNAIRTILEPHNALEEGPEGVYERCERLVGGEGDALLGALRAAPEVAVAPHVESPLVVESTRRAVARAGYDATILGL